MTSVEKEFLINKLRDTRNTLDKIIDKLYYRGDCLCYDEYEKDVNNIQREIKYLFDNIDYKAYIMQENSKKSRNTVHYLKKKGKIIKQIKRSSE